MRLYDEFLSRLDIRVPIIEHHNEWAFLFRTYGEGWKTPFVLMQVQWVQMDNRVGQYLITFNRAIHDGHAHKRYFEKYNDIRVNWDEYDSYFTNWEVRRYIKPGLKESMTPIHGDNEMLFSAWEMFVYTHDNWIARQSPEFRVYVEGVVDDARSDNERIRSYQNALLYLTTREPSVLRVWKNEVMGRLRNYGHWLGRLLTTDALPPMDDAQHPMLQATGLE
jgi:hypothetical protein